LGFECSRPTFRLGWTQQVALGSLLQHLRRRKYLSHVFDDGTVDNVDRDVQAGPVPAWICGRQVVVAT